MSIAGYQMLKGIRARGEKTHHHSEDCYLGEKCTCTSLYLERLTNMGSSRLISVYTVGQPLLLY